MKWTPRKVNQIRDLVGIGWTDRQIGNLLGLSPAAVRMARSRHGVRRQTRRDSNLSRALDRTEDGTEPTDMTADLASRLAQLQGLVTVEEPHQEPLSDTRLQEFLHDPETLFEFLGIELFPYQKEGLDLILANDRTCLVWGRQNGKCFLTALYGLYVSLTQPGSVTICVSPSQRQSDLWMEKLRGFALAKAEIRDAIVDISQTQVTFSNGAKVYSLPSGSQGSATIRGFSKVTVLVVNEAAWVSDETFAAVQPFLAASGGGKVVLISTPFGQSGYLWRAWGNDLYAKSNIPSSASPLISDEFLKTEGQTMDALTFASEYEARFMSSQSAYFGTELVQGCVEGYPLVETPSDEHKDMKFYLGCDWGRVEGGDRTVLTVVGIDEEGLGKILWIKVFEATDYMQQASYITWLHGLWRFRKIFSDASNHATNDNLISKGLPVEPVNFTVPTKVELYSRLKAALESGKLILPNHTDLLRELSLFEYRISEKGNLLLHHPPGGHDDFPDSTALACRELTSHAFKPALFGVDMGQGRIVGRARPEKRDIIAEYFPLDAGRREPDCAVCKQQVGHPRVLRGGKVYHQGCQDEE